MLRKKLTIKNVVEMTMPLKVLTMMPTTAAAIKATRQAAGLTQAEAAERFDYSLRVWQKKESETETGKNSGLSQGEFELLLLLAGKHPDYILTPKK
jgi:transcriptional regulator with XRE-family HTH domain